MEILVTPSMYFDKATYIIYLFCGIGLLLPSCQASRIDS